MPFTWNTFTISADSMHDTGCAYEIEQKIELILLRVPCPWYLIHLSVIDSRAFYLFQMWRLLLERLIANIFQIFRVYLLCMQLFHQ